MIDRQQTDGRTTSKPAIRLLFSNKWNWSVWQKTVYSSNSNTFHKYPNPNIMEMMSLQWEKRRASLELIKKNLHIDVLYDDPRFNNSIEFYQKQKNRCIYLNTVGGKMVWGQQSTSTICYDLSLAICCISVIWGSFSLHRKICLR